MYESQSQQPPPLPNYCSQCGADSMQLKIPQGDERLRAVCANCGHVVYHNPKIVVACVLKTNQNNLLLAKRAIEPRLGTWGIPQGFMEHGETTREAASREVWEETGAVIDPARLKFRALYNVPGSVQLLYEASDLEDSLIRSQIASYNSTLGESLEVELVAKEALGEKELCFPTVQWALDHCLSEPNVIQQMTKYYDKAQDVWSEYEDEVLR